jgi:hypothetical protein
MMSCQSPASNVETLVTVCSWCLARNPPRLRFLSPVALGPGESLELHEDGAGAMTFFKGRPGQMVQLRVSHGICSEHAAQLRAEPSRVQ